MTVARTFTEEIAIVLAGEAGKGIQSIEQVLDRVFMRAGYRVFSTGEFMSRIRGGCNSTLLRIGTQARAAFSRRIDLLIPFDAKAIEHCRDRISSQTLIIADSAKAGNGAHVNVPFSRLAVEAGGPLFEGAVAAGFLLGLFRIAPALFEAFIQKQFGAKGPELVEKNVAAGRLGFAEAARVLDCGLLDIRIPAGQADASDLLMSGTEAVGLGALAGGCDFVSGYPMSPATGVIAFLARQTHDFPLIFEQAEDEIAALNMVLGAWYAGARALASTSGGGFALMCEAVSLAGMIESPAVIHIGQRPGPATGLPTRTEQGDLELALYSGHGEFPRAIFAPGMLEEAFSLTRRAFDLADECQTPVFILTDEFLLDSYFMTPPFDSGPAPRRHIVKSDSSYRRYALVENGVSPRSVPGFGEGVVRVDSDEHTEEGLITESAEVRRAMVEKRLSKARLLQERALKPRVHGSFDAPIAVVCWGSTYHCAQEAIARVGRGDIRLVHYAQLWPLHCETASILKDARLRICVENNATAQFARLVRQQTGVEFHSSITHYTGLPLSVEELADRITEAIGRG